MLKFNQISMVEVGRPKPIMYSCNIIILDLEEI